MKRALLLACSLAVFGTGCSSDGSSSSGSGAPTTFPEVAVREHGCMSALQSYLTNLDAPRMDRFFGAALNGLLKCESTSGLAHVPTRDVSRWLATANGTRRPTQLPKEPRAIAVRPANDDVRIAYQRACVAYMRSYLPASIANAGDDPDVAAAFVFNVLESCDGDAGFATIAPSDLAAMMEKKHLL